MKFLFHPFVSLAIRLFLGGIFVISGALKIADPPAFAHMLYNYRLLPGTLINTVALVMPWLELSCGVALILGKWKQPAATIITGMLVVFIVALGINLSRDHAVDCGCFDLYVEPRTHEDLISDMKWTIIRDIGLLLLCAQILASGSKPGRVHPANLQLDRASPQDQSIT